MDWRGGERFFVGIGLVRWGVGLRGVVGRGRGCGCGGIVFFGGGGGGFILGWRFLVAREGDIG